ncbi:asparagine synthase (glutamine-hydrolyzing) [bacterium]|nr:asparagine synthase (glutamine-hydrolyzing) [bacterium]
MCGICGVYNFGNKDPVNQDLIKRMTEALKHRGPNDEGFYIRNNMGMGVRRLRVIDLETGHQPIHNEDKTIWIVFNGEIYNFRDLREALEKKGHIFYTKSDTEVILHLYEEYGRDCVQRLNGMFAFAIWDSREERLFLARDRIGIKPLFYVEHKGSIVFASEIKSILEKKEISKEIDVQSLYSMMKLQYIPAPKTIFKEIKKLLPGHRLACQKGKISIEKYWDLDLARKEESEAFYLKELPRLLEESIRLRLISDVPLGAFLSGGIDSSIMVGLMSKFSEKPVKTYSVGFEAEDSFNELKYARLASQHFKTDHQELIMKSKDIEELLPKIVYYLDDPITDPAVIPTYLVSKLAKEKVTVVLTGEGGDELFAGYRRYSLDRLAPYYGKLPSIIRKKMIPVLISKLFPKGRFQQGIEALNQPPGVQRHLKWISKFSDQTLEKLYIEQMKESIRKERLESIFWPYFEVSELQKQKTAESEARRYFESPQERDFRSRTLYCDIKTWLPDDLLVKVDRMSMATSLEARVPYLDHRIVELCTSMPIHLKLRGFTSKYILRKAFSDLIPEKILKRRKQGFTVPLAFWFRKELRNFTQEILSQNSIAKRGYFDYNYIKHILEEHFEGKRDYSRELWSLLVFELWSKRYLEN